jgi:hypothetical protein
MSNKKIYKRNENDIKEYDINVIKMISILSTGKPISKKDIAKSLDISTRYVERIFKTINEDYFELLIKKRIWKGKEIIYELTKNEPHVPKTFIVRNPDEKSVRNNYKYGLNERRFNVVVSDIRKAIEKRLKTELIYNYYTQFKVTYNILPLEIIFCHDLRIAAIDLNIPDRWSIFSLTEEDTVLKIHTTTCSIDIPTPKPEFDDFFLFSTNNNINHPMEAKLILTRVSYNFTLRLYPQLKKRIEKLNDNEIADYNNEVFLFKYKLVIKFYNIKSLGSLVSGMFNHFKVITSNEVIDLLKNYIEQKITNKIESNLIIE